MYILLAIIFGAAALYYYAADYVKKNAFRDLTEGEIEKYELPKGEELKIFDMDKVHTHLNIMIVCFYPAYPVIMVQRLIQKLFS